MLQQNILSLFTRMLPEAFLVIYAIYRLTNTNVNMKKILISSVIGGIGVYATRLFPIHFGVHTIIAIMLYIILAVNLNKIEMYKAITSALVSQILLFISDFIFIIIYTNCFKFPSEVIVGKTWISAVAGIPPLILFYLIILLIAFFYEKRKNNEQN